MVPSRFYILIESDWVKVRGDEQSFPLFFSFTPFTMVSVGGKGN
jgi:hypothetical protein